MSSGEVIPGGCAYMLQLAVADDKKPIGVNYDSHHCTLLYVGEHLTHESRGLLLEIGNRVIEAEEGMLINLRLNVRNVAFYGRDELVVEVEKGGRMVRLREALQRHLKLAGIAWSEKYPEFKPHVTLGMLRHVPQAIEVVGLTVKLGRVYISL
jgi:2'-5' RNA ligase